MKNPKNEPKRNPKDEEAKRNVTPIEGQRQTPERGQPTSNPNAPRSTDEDESEDENEDQEMDQRRRA
jgi:hypothetical protein